MNILRRVPLTMAWVTGAAILWTGGPPLAAQSPQPPVLSLQEPAEPLRPTLHAALPQNVEDYWLVPARKARVAVADASLTSAAASFAAGNFTAALAAAVRASQDGPLGPYALFYRGLAHLRLSQPADAEAAFDAVLERKPSGYLAEGALLGKAEAAEVRGDHAAAADIYEKVASQKTVAPDDVLSRLGRAALAAGDRKRAAAAFERVYYEFPLSEASPAAAAALAALPDEATHDPKRDLARALMLFGVRRYADARELLTSIQGQLDGDDHELADLRVAECDFFMKRYAAARDGVRPYLDNASRKAEARFFYLSAIRGLGDEVQYVSLTRALVADFPDSTWSEEALNNLGTYYILDNDEPAAAQAFRECYEKFPRGQHAERAAWKYGWWAYKTGSYAETIRVFESAAAAFPRSDYRPPFLYWSARARARSGDRATANVRYRLVYTDYMNSYYGRLAQKQIAVQNAGLDGGGAVTRTVSVQEEQAPAVAPPANAAVVRGLIASGMLDDALTELRYAQKAYGTSPIIEATMAWIYHEKGDLRRAITTMRRAYPQHLAAGGEALPAEILQIIFPLTYWDSIRRNATARDLDPYVVAALINQESTFDPGAHSSANAWGLMQVVPSTGRRLAASVGIRRFRVSMLTNADTNIRLGTLFFSRLVRQFGGAYYALASYNAGESRVVRWKMERPGLEEDEFIDDIPFPETQNYVKRILGTAEDYRHLYGEDGARPVAPPHAAKAVKASSKAPAAKKEAPAKKKAPRKKHHKQ